MQGVGLGCATQSQSTPLSGDIDPHRTIHGIAQKRKLNGAICVALGVQEAIAGHHKGAWVQVVGHVADAAHPKIDRYFHFRSPAAPRTTVPGSMVKVSPGLTKTCSVNTYKQSHVQCCVPTPAPLLSDTNTVSREDTVGQPQASPAESPWANADADPKKAHAQNARSDSMVQNYKHKYRHVILYAQTT